MKKYKNEKSLKRFQKNFYFGQKKLFCGSLRPRPLKMKTYSSKNEKTVLNFQKSLPGGHQKSIVFIICEILKNDFFS